LDTPRPQGRDDVGFSALHLYESLSAISAMLATSPWKERLSAIEKRALAVDRARRKERGLPER
jgi:hypothetical protein